MLIRTFFLAYFNATVWLSLIILHNGKTKLYQRRRPYHHGATFLLGETSKTTLATLFVLDFLKDKPFMDDLPPILLPQKITPDIRYFDGKNNVVVCFSNVAWLDIIRKKNTLAKIGIFIPALL